MPEANTNKTSFLDEKQCRMLDPQYSRLPAASLHFHYIIRLKVHQVGYPDGEVQDEEQRLR